MWYHSVLENLCTQLYVWCDCVSDNLTTTINTVKESQHSQRELSSDVSSLQAFQKNMSVGAGKWSVFFKYNFKVKVIGWWSFLQRLNMLVTA